MRKRGRDFGLMFNGLPGTHNSITDVPGVLVGQKTLSTDCIPAKKTQSNAVITGVTAILPRGIETTPSPVYAGFSALNGNGEMTGTHWIRDAGSFLGPICLTNTHSVGVVHHAAVKWMISHYGLTFQQDHIWAMPVVAETYDGVLNDINAQHVTEAHALEALNKATSGPIAEGNTGGGAGMICYEFKGGTGTSSRCVKIDGHEYHIGILVQANHGIRDWLTVLGEPVGRKMQNDRLIENETGSIIAIIATDIPLRPDQLNRIARRGAIGISRSGTPGGNNSGDIFLAFSTANKMALPHKSPSRCIIECLNDEFLDTAYEATAESIDEAIINAMFAARDVPTFKPPGKICKAINTDQLIKLLKDVGKCK